MAVILVLMSTASLHIFQNIPKLLVPKLAILLVKICTTNLHSFQYIKKNCYQKSGNNNKTDFYSRSTYISTYAKYISTSKGATKLVLKTTRDIHWFQHTKLILVPKLAIRLLKKYNTDLHTIKIY